MPCKSLNRLQRFYAPFNEELTCADVNDTNKTSAPRSEPSFGRFPRPSVRGLIDKSQLELKLVSFKLVSFKLKHMYI